MPPTIRTVAAIRDELAWGRRSLESGFARFAADTMAFRALRLFPYLPSRDSEAQLTTREGVHITYRRNRGDIQSIREVFIKGVYRLPEGPQPRTLVDLGGNIGLTTLWLARRYPSLARAVVVEPFAPNAALAERNFSNNAVDAEVISAAVTSRSGTVRFVASHSSNMGRVGQDSGSLEVRAITMAEIISLVGAPIDILKMDIEGAEQELLTAGDLSWLDAVGCIVAEFHPQVVDYHRLTEIISQRGFVYHRAGSLWPTSMDMFLRRDGLTT